MAELLASHNQSDPDLSSGALQRGTKLGRYELLLPVAVGGMARVWAARLNGQRGFTKLVAIKTILPHLAIDPEFERMFLDEARIASGVHHPNVCEIYELGEERGVLYLAMEWVNGDSLSHVLKREAARDGGAAEPLNPRVAARIVADACAGLHAAHNLADEEGRALSVVHRDVSPHNILVSADGNVKVADFGVAKALGQSSKTAAGQLKGKIAYMSPEQVAGGAVDRRSDLFSLGSVLYEATTGRQPFRGEGDHQVMNELIRGQLTPPSRLIKGYPFELERIILRAMSAQPLQRFPTMDRMRIALEEWLAKSGPVLTQSHVAAVVRERVGAEMDKRKDRIRAASNASIPDRDVIDPAQMTPSGPSAKSLSGVVPAGDVPSGAIVGPSTPPPPSVDGGVRASTVPPPPVMPPMPATPAVATPNVPLPAVELATSSRHATPLQYAIAAGVGVLAAGVVAIAAFLVWRSMSALPASQPVAAEAPRASMAAMTSAPAMENAAAPAPAPAPSVAFRIVPDSAVLVIDGKPLASSVRAIPRPKAGETIAVTVHAEGFDDEALKIDDSAPPAVDVWLTEKKAPARAGEAATTGAAPPGRTPGGKGGKAPETLPANPY